MFCIMVIWTVRWNVLHCHVNVTPTKIPNSPKNPAYISFSVLIWNMTRTCSWQVSQSKNKGFAIFNIQIKKVKTSIYQRSLCPENVMGIQVFDSRNDSMKDCVTKRCEVIFKDSYWFILHSCNSIHYF